MPCHTKPQTIQPQAINAHGDQLIAIHAGHGSDIASQRADDLDMLALNWITQFVAQRGHSPQVIELACGMGGQALRMAQAGATVLASDLVDSGAAIRQQATQLGIQCAFVRLDLRDHTALRALGPCHALLCQRAIHYLPYPQAQQLLHDVFTLLQPRQGQLFLSASGLGSELGDEYPARDAPLLQRHAPLSAAMQAKHGIQAPVCLYTAQEMRELLCASGFTPTRIYASPFGNIKAVAHA